MATLAPARPAGDLLRRRIPPLPHPSWAYPSERPASSRSLTARDFWERLGL